MERKALFRVRSSYSSDDQHHARPCWVHLITMSGARLSRAQRIAVAEMDVPKTLASRTISSASIRPLAAFLTRLLGNSRFAAN